MKCFIILKSEDNTAKGCIHIFWLSKV